MEKVFKMVLVRMPASLHRQAKAAAKSAELSLTMFVSKATAKACGVPWEKPERKRRAKKEK